MDIAILGWLAVGVSAAYANLVVNVLLVRKRGANSRSTYWLGGYLADRNRGPLWKCAMFLASVLALYTCAIGITVIIL